MPTRRRGGGLSRILVPTLGVSHQAKIKDTDVPERRMTLGRTKTRQLAWTAISAD
jgi:hypothetical protein